MRIHNADVNVVTFGAYLCDDPKFHLERDVKPPVSTIQLILNTGFYPADHTASPGTVN